MLSIREISHIRSIMRGSISSISAAVASAALSFLGMLSPASATDFNAGTVMEKMDPHEQASYIQGVVEGLAYARYQRDNQHIEGDAKTMTGMKCVYAWFYEKPNTLKIVFAAFDKFPSYPPAAIISSLIKQNCPE